MIDAATVEECMRDANPIPTLDAIDADEFAYFVATTRARRAAAIHAPTQHPTSSTPTARQYELGWARAPVAKREESTMVTRQQPDIETPTPIPTTPPQLRSRRGPLIAAAVAVVVILAGVGIAFATGAFDSDADVAAERLVVATELVDTWNQGWEGQDPETVVSVFVDDGVYIDSDGTTYTMDEMRLSYIPAASYLMSNVDRIGDLTPSGEETYTWVSEIVTGSIRYEGEQEIELEGDLAARIETLSAYKVIEPGSGS